MSGRHSAPAGGPDPVARRRLRLLLAAVLVPVVLATVLGVVLLRPDGAVPRLPDGVGPQADLVRAEVVDREEVPCPGGEQPGVRCLLVQAELASGERVAVEVVDAPLTPFPDDGAVLLSYDPVGDAYAFADVERSGPLLLLGGLFALAVVALGRWTGLRALVGLGLSLGVVLLFLLPALLTGQSPLPVALVGSAAVALVVLPLAHGLRLVTAIALLGTLASLVLTVGLAELFVRLTALTGLGSDETSLLASTVEGVDLRGLLLAGVVIGSLGVLDDVTVTQSSAVWELHQADPTAGVRRLYAAGTRIGRDHVASTVNTLVLAYVGASLPLLVISSLAGADLRDVLTSEVVAQEVVRTLVGSIGLVAAVPLTTLLAAAVVRHDVRRPAADARG